MPIKVIGNRRWIIILVWLMPAIFLTAFPLAFFNRAIHIDEAWIGEQAFTLQKDGAVYNNLFRDFPPLDKEIVIYHRLPVWLGAAAINIFGWGLYPLRMISALAGVALIISMLLSLSRIYSLRTGIIAALILLWTPQFWEGMRIFRPEIIVTFFGFASFIFARQASQKKEFIYAVASGICAGLSGLAHPLGLIFVPAGFLALVFEKKIIPAAILTIVSLAVFFPYVFGLFENKELFLRQLTDNGIMTSKINISWWTPLLNLLNEHKRVFRNGDVIGISVLFLLSLILRWRDRSEAGSFFWRYLTTVFVLLAIAPFPKITRYFLPLIPFLVLYVSLAVKRLVREFSLRAGGVQTILTLWLVLFAGYGFYALGRAAIIDRHAPRDLETNRLLAGKMEAGAAIIARFDMVFNYIDDYTILSWWGCEQKLMGHFDPESVEKYADNLGIRYLVITKYNLEQMSLNSLQLSSRFRYYLPVLMLPERERYLFVRKADDPTPQ